MKKEIAQAAEYLVKFLPIVLQLRANPSKIKEYALDLAGRRRSRVPNLFQAWVRGAKDAEKASRHFDDLNRLWEQWLQPAYESDAQLKSLIDALAGDRNDIAVENSLRHKMASFLEGDAAFLKDTLALCRFASAEAAESEKPQSDEGRGKKPTVSDASTEHKTDERQREPGVEPVVKTYDDIPDSNSMDDLGTHLTKGGFHLGGDGRSGFG